MRRRCALLVAVLSVVLIGAIAPNSTLAQSVAMKPVKLMVNGADYLPTIPDSMVMQYFCNEVEKRTNGLITWRYAWSQSLTKRGEELDALKSGLSDVALVT